MTISVSSLFAIVLWILFLQMVFAEEFNCTFDTNMCGWTQDQQDTLDWTRGVNGTSTGGTGPDFDHTTGHGYYLYIETSGFLQEGNAARLISPVIDGTNQTCLVFYYHMYGVHIGELNVYLSRNGSLGSPVWTKRKSQGNEWKKATVEITGGSSTAAVTNVVFEAVRGADYLGDIAIDDVGIQAGNCPGVPSGELRLISPLDNGIGRLEVYYNGSWGTVCDNSFEEAAAEVACKQLGLMKSWSKPTIVEVPPGTGRIWLDDVRCKGNENSLSECPHRPWGSHRCSHSQDVGVDCDILGLTCTFETDTCGWTQGLRDSFNWKWSSSRNGTGPNSDHTSGRGSYVYIDTSYPGTKEELAHLLSPIINGSARTCLTFYYHMFGLNVSSLNVYLYTIGRAGSPVWTKFKSQGNTWKKGKVQIEGGSATSQIRQIVFEGVRGEGYQGTIAIDDVMFTPGTCPEDGFNCTFETNICGWTQEKRDRFDWTRHANGTTTRGTGPDFDHTSGHGYYMYIEASGFLLEEGHPARLISPVIDGTEQMCVVFYYHMYGLHIGALNVYFFRNGSLGSPVWTKLKSQGNAWKRGTIQIDGESTTASVTNVVFEGLRGANYEGDIAIDDISLQTGTCPGEPPGTLRLISPLNNGIGRLEVYYNGSWGTVCKNGFSEKTAKVACKQLGITEPWSKPRVVNVPPGSGKIWLDDIICNGDESSLVDCNHRPWGTHSCSHSQDVGVDCDILGLNCTFESDICGWTQGLRDSFNWKWSSSRNGSGPNTDHTSGRGSYVYINTSYPEATDQEAHLLSPYINGSARACFTFYYHMFGQKVSTLNVYLYAIGRGGDPDWTKTESQGNIWKKGMVQIEGGSATARIRQVVFEGVRGEGYHGSISVDDVTVTPGTCPEEGFNCTFDTSACGWTQDRGDDFDWTRKANGTTTRGTGPDFDHTSGHGYYMYIEASTFLLQEGNTARITSPVINGADKMCLVFYYHMYSAHIGALNVYLSRNGSLGSPVWTKGQPQGNDWKRATVQITGGSETAAATNVVFEGVRGPDFQGDIAVDDVSLLEGICPEEPPGTLRLISPLENGIGRLEVYYNGSWGTVCDNSFEEAAAEVACKQLGLMKSWSKPTIVKVPPGTGRIWLDDVRCKGNENSLSECPHRPWGSHRCSHSQDVGVDCDILGLTCTFETDTCGWTQGLRDSFNWKWSSSRNGTGPSSDHTSGRGSYVYIDTSYPGTKEESAHLLSPIINGSARTCLTFYYHMFGQNVSSLNVYLYTIGRAGSPVWTRSKSQGNTWKKGKVQIEGGSATSQIRQVVFEGLRGEGYQGSIAVDDVLFRPGTCPEDGFNCTFETNICGWTQEKRDRFDWTRQANGTTTRGTGPDFDHTSGHGYYMYIEASGFLLEEGHPARLISPVIDGTERNCVVFYYHMYGLHIGALNVYFFRNGSLGSPVWTKLKSQGNVWKKAKIQIEGGSTTASVTNVVFEGLRGANYEGDIAIDDISLQTGTCPGEPPGTLRLISPLNNGIGRLEVYYNGSWGTVCKNGFSEKTAKVACEQLGITEPWSKPKVVNVPPGSGRIWLDDILCNGDESSLIGCNHRPWGTHSCSHSQDVGVDCDILGLNCTFESDICGWTQGLRDSFNWEWSSSRNGSGPSSDHTSGRGSYVFINTSYPGASDQEAHLLSPYINGSARACFTFYYHMFGQTVSTLNVYLYAIGRGGDPDWTKVGSQGNIWKKGMVQIEGGSATARIRQIVFEGVRGEDYQGGIAIDDVTVTPGTCPEDGFNCTFDTNSCGWTQERGENFDWTRQVNGTTTRGTGPDFDHTSGHGYYMYIEASTFLLQEGNTARITSPVINGTNQMCLVFYYHMYGAHIGALHVYLSRNGSLGSPVWTKGQPQANEWKRATVQIIGGSNTSSVTNVVFEGVRGAAFQGDIAIDDVSLLAGTCPEEPPGELRLISPIDNGIGRLEVYYNGSWGTVCKNGFTDQAAKVACQQLGLMKSWSKPTVVKVPPGTGRIWLDDVRCSGNETSLSVCPHSPWGSHSCSHSQDVGVDCDILGLACTFETDTCGWTQGLRDSFNWQWSSSRNGTGPNSDHTSGRGSYVYIDTSYQSVKEELAHLISPIINGSDRTCLTFYYHMYGLNVSALNVYLYAIGRAGSPVWTKSKSQGTAWKKGMVQIEGGSNTAQIRQIIFEGVRGSGYRGTIAIDDVKITPGTCKQVTVTTEPPGKRDGDVNVTSGNRLGIIIGVIAALIIIALVAVIIYLYRKLYKRSGFADIPMKRL